MHIFGTIILENILITGGAGYIGSVLSKFLLDQGYFVTVLDNFRYNQNSLFDCCYSKNFKVIRGNVCDESVLSSSMENQDFIIHLAALVGAPVCNANKNEALSTNFESTKLLLKLRSVHQKILFSCTNSGYGVGEKGKFCTEDTPLRPISLYEQTKVNSEQAILKAGDSISFRLATVFGVSPRMRLDLLVNNFVYKAMTDKFIGIFEGHFQRNYIHIRDVVRAFHFGIKNFEKMKNQAYNVGLSDANLSKLELCKKIKQHLSDFIFVESKLGKDPDKRDYIVSNEKIESMGFKPEFSLDFGIEELIKYCKILPKQSFGNF